MYPGRHTTTQLQHIFLRVAAGRSPGTANKQVSKAQCTRPVRVVFHSCCDLDQPTLASKKPSESNIMSSVSSLPALHTQPLPHPLRTALSCSCVKPPRPAPLALTTDCTAAPVRPGVLLVNSQAATGGLLASRRHHGPGETWQPSTSPLNTLPENTWLQKHISLGLSMA